MALPDPPGLVPIQSVRGCHLGRCARRILLLSPGPDDEPQIVIPEREGRGAAESHRRSMRRLAEIGLVELSLKAEVVRTRREKEGTPLQWDGDTGVYREGQAERIPVLRSVEKRAVKLTLLGAIVVDRFRSALETGERIRWNTIADGKAACIETESDNAKQYQKKT
jgi:hypothetical protein